MDLNTLTIIGLIALVTILLFISATFSNTKRKVYKNNTYAYIAKQTPMTKTEAEFFAVLNDAVSERYYVFPQVHLSAILWPNAQGKERTYAFRHINGKSVDYVLCDRKTLRPTYAIELDDYTHNQPSRRKRDAEVERIFDQASLPLVRFSDKNVSADQIIKRLMDANDFVTIR